MTSRWVLVLLAILVAIPASVSAVTVNFDDRNLTTAITTMDMEGFANITIVGNNTGMVRGYSPNGSIRWQTQLFGGAVKKVLLAGNSANGSFVASTYGGFVYYGSAYNGAIRGVYDAGNVTGYDPGSGKQGNWTEIDITDDGEKWLVVGRNKTEVKDTGNKTIGYRYNTQDRATSLFTGGVIDPDGAFVIVANSTDGSVHQWLVANTTTPADWYQGYKYRKPHVITGSSEGYLEYWNGTYIRIFNTTGVSSGSDVYIGANITRPDYFDIKVVDTSTNQPVQAYISSTGSNYAKITLLFQNLTRLQTKNLYIYYGNNTATSFNNRTSEVGDDIGEIHYNGSEFNWDFESGGANDWTAGVSWPYLVFFTQGVASGTVFVSGTSSKTFYLNNFIGANSHGINGTATYGFGATYDYDAQTDALALGCSCGSGSGNSYAFDKNGAVVSQATSSCPGGAGQTFTPKKINFSANGSATTYPASGWYLGYAVSSFGSPCTGQARFSVDNITNIRRWVDVPPTHGAWGATETRNDLSPNSRSAYSGVFSSMDLPWNAPLFLALATTTNYYMVPVDVNGFTAGSSMADATLPAYQTHVADGGAFAMEGRGFTAQVVTQSAVLDGTLDSVTFAQMTANDINTLSGLWGTFCDDGGKFYVISKAGVSTWFDFFDADEQFTALPFPACKAVTMSPEALFAGAGRNDGDVIVYYLAGTTPAPNATPTPETWVQDAYVFKNGNPYQGIAVSVYESPSAGGTFTLRYSLTTDSSGRIAFTVPAAGYYYQFNVNNGEYIGTKVTSSSHTTMTLSIVESMIDYSYLTNATEAGPGHVAYTFRSLGGTPTFVNVSVVFARNDTLYSTTSYASSANIADTYDVGNKGINLKIVSYIFYPGNATPFIDTKLVTNTTTLPSFPLPSLDMPQKNALFIILVMIIAGLFSYSNAHKGAIIVVAVALLLRLMGLITVDYTIIIIAGGFAIMSAFARGSRVP